MKILVVAVAFCFLASCSHPVEDKIRRNARLLCTIDQLQVKANAGDAAAAKEIEEARAEMKQIDAELKEGMKGKQLDAAFEERVAEIMDEEAQRCAEKK